MVLYLHQTITSICNENNNVTLQNNLQQTNIC